MFLQPWQTNQWVIVCTNRFISEVLGDNDGKPFTSEEEANNAAAHLKNIHNLDLHVTCISKQWREY